MSKLFINDTSLTAIGDAIREKTGKEDLLTLEQMPQEIRGIESGGGGGLAYDTGEFVLDTDVTARKWINHNLGDIPEFVCIWTDDFKDISEENPSPYNNTTWLGYMWLDNLFGLPQRLTSAVSSKYGVFIANTLLSNVYAATSSAPTSTSYGLDSTTLPTAQQFYLANMGASTLWRAGVTYKYFVSKGWWDKK